MYTITTTIICNIALVLIFLIINVSIVKTSISYKFEFSNTIKSYLPQGWAFFTRSPREAQVLVYRVTEGRLEMIEQRHSMLRNFIGLKRDASLFLAELSMIKNSVSDSLFSNTKWNYQKGIFGKYPEKSIYVPNKVMNSKLNGEYLLVLQQPIKWAWYRKDDQKMLMPARCLFFRTEE